MTEPDPPTAASTSPSTDWRRRYAFGWPEGSVRALMALIIFGSICALILTRPDQELPEALRDLLFIILGHYFAVRSRGTVAETAGPPPLYLPRGSVRFLLIGLFVATAILLFRQGKLLAIDRNPAVVTLLLVSGFLLGVVVRLISNWLTPSDRPPSRVFEDLRAGVSFAAALFLAVLLWDQFSPYSQHWGLNEINLHLGRIGAAQVAAAIVGFYFGSRS